MLETDINGYLSSSDARMKEFEMKIKQNLAKRKFVPEPINCTFECSNIHVKEDCFKGGSCSKSEQIDEDDLKDFMKSIFMKKDEVTDQRVLTDKENVAQEKENCRPKTSFKTASELMGNTRKVSTSNSNNSNQQRRTLGMKRSISNKFISPVINKYDF